ncbi:MAG: hypothetical protein ACFNZD_03520, partial [Candidatus Nanoperiomorbus sp.]
TLRLVIISFRPAWLARDTALASSVHSLQEMTDADEGRKTPFNELMVVVYQSNSPKLPMAVDIAIG